MNEENFNKNVLIATLVSAVLILFWYGIFGKKEVPNDDFNSSKKIESTIKEEIKEKPKDDKAPEVFIDRNESINETKSERISVENNVISGSIYLKGLRFDDLNLKNYNIEINSKDKVKLLSPLDTESFYFIDFGWISNNKNIDLPTVNTIWKTDAKNIGIGQETMFYYDNSKGLVFKVFITLDKNYMFSVRQEVENKTSESIILTPYARITKKIEKEMKVNGVVHSGLIGVFDKKLEEIQYKKLIKKGFNFEGKGYWSGFTDKYWLTTIIFNSETNLKNKIYADKETIKNEIYGENIEVKSNETKTLHYNIFTGAKVLKLLDYYKTELQIPMFDRAVDFGWFYFLTKPLYLLLRLFFQVFGNFGVAILLLTLLVKALMYPITQRSFDSMAKMKLIQPKIVELRKKYEDDKIRMNQELMNVYKKNKINPLSGCLPMLLQIPVFFSLYRVFSVTIDMRHAKFFGYIRDLSAQDPTTIWNLFGLLPFDVNVFHLGFLPCLMAFTMWLQQKMSDTSGSDQTMATATKMMPFIFLVLFASFPTGLLLYWTFSNILSIGQQYLIERRYKKLIDK